MDIGFIGLGHMGSGMVRCLLKENGFKMSAFRDVGMLDADYKAICKAVRR